MFSYRTAEGSIHQIYSELLNSPIDTTLIPDTIRRRKRMRGSIPENRGVQEEFRETDINAGISVVEVRRRTWEKTWREDTCPTFIYQLAGGSRGSITFKIIITFGCFLRNKTNFFVCLFWGTNEESEPIFFARVFIDRTFRVEVVKEPSETNTGEEVKYG